ncbi:MAG: DinB family protein [Acidobacteriota bacterium]|nr:DinB family protein [Acidobacteriota bacterium]
MPLADELSLLFQRDLTRLIQELHAFPSEESLWAKAPGVSNSAGNLFLHLEGNMREFIGRQLGGVAYTRNRDLEFGSPPVPAAEIARRIEALPPLITRVVAGLSDGVMNANYPEAVGGLRQSTRHFLLHLYGHLNYHMGQIDYIRRIVTGTGPVRFAQL